MTDTRDSRKTRAHNPAYTLSETHTGTARIPHSNGTRAVSYNKPPHRPSRPLPGRALTEHIYTPILMKNFFSTLIAKVTDFINYCWTGVWREPQETFRVRFIKTISLSIRAFMDRDLQQKSAALTYSTVLAIVPALALLFAIGRGFGFQDLLASNIMQAFPSQHQALQTAIGFVDSYLKEAKSGLFVGIGIVMLLWTLISLLSTIEQSFNKIWDIRKDRTIYQKITDYVSICLIVPVLMVCSSGVSIFMSTTVQNNLHLAFLTPLVNTSLEAAPLVLAWLAFSMSFLLIPNTKVSFRYAAIAGAIAAIAFQILQLLFVNGQIYVSKYNAIYGSFAFLPLLLIWLQLSWLVLLFGCALTYSMQNIFAFNFLGNVEHVAPAYQRKLTLVIVAAIVDAYVRHRTPPTRNQISSYYDIPVRIVSNVAEELIRRGLLYNVALGKDDLGLTPAFNLETFSAGDLFREMDCCGSADFVPHFKMIYPAISADVDEWNSNAWNAADSVLLRDIKLPSPDEVRKVMMTSPGHQVSNGIP